MKIPLSLSKSFAGRNRNISVPIFQFPTQDSCVVDITAVCSVHVHISQKWFAAVVWGFGASARSLSILRLHPLGRCQAWSSVASDLELCKASLPPVASAEISHLCSPASSRKVGLHLGHIRVTVSNQGFKYKTWIILHLRIQTLSLNFFKKISFRW